MKIRYWLQRPQLIWSRLRYLVWEMRNPQAPWLTVGAVAYCDSALARSMRVLELGSGRSTSWFAHRAGHVTSVEHSAEWFSRVRATLDREGLDNVDYHLIPLNHSESEPEMEDYDPIPSYVRLVQSLNDDSLDLIVVDGHYRTACIRACPAKLRIGGLLLVDDINWWGGPELVPVPKGWPLVHLSNNGLKATGIWKKTTQNWPHPHEPVLEGR